MLFRFHHLSAIAAVLLSAITSSDAKVIGAPVESGETERIVGGRDAAPGQFPWAASLFKNGNFICTCSIISENTVLTAAHCVVTKGQTEPASAFHAIANVRKSSPSYRMQFASVTPHPEYSANGIQNDIALFRTTQPIPFSDTVQPICIARSDTDAMQYSNATAMGWGDTQRFRIIPFIPDVLQYVAQRIINNQQCGRYYGQNEAEPYKICAGDLFKGICNGDSGGPLVHLSANQVPVQLGVASYGSAIFGCAFVVPSVWTRVSSFNSFIKSVANGDNICEV